MAVLLLSKPSIDKTKTMKKLSLLLLFTALLFSGCVSYRNGIRLDSPANQSTVSLLTPVQAQFLALTREERGRLFEDQEFRRHLTSQGCLPNPVTFAWTAWTDYTSQNFTIEISLSPDFQEKITIRTSKTSATLSNLEIARTYYWRVVSGTQVSPVWSFQTADRTPRLMKIQGVPNCRDLGGYIAWNGKRVRQGIVFRSAALNNDTVVTFKPAPESEKTGEQAPPPVVKSFALGKSRLNEVTKSYVRDVLGIHSEIDLRDEFACLGMNASLLGPSVRWFHLPLCPYDELNTEQGKAAVADILRVFLDENNYPILFHGSDGKVRTGAVAFIVNALLGVRENELYKDWEATAFWDSTPAFNHKDLFRKLYRTFDAYPGQTIQERVRMYFLAIGFTHEQLRRLRDLMLD